MIRTINPCAAAARTAEIMARYRPIAPKPEAAAENDNSALPNGIRKSPYLRNIWAHLQARPTRTRKRGRSAAFAPPPVKQARPACLPPPYQIAMHGFTSAAAVQKQPPEAAAQISFESRLNTAISTLTESISSGTPKPIDLNTAAPVDQFPEELDFLAQLQRPLPPVIISPKPVRPVVSTITVTTRLAETPADQPADDAETTIEAEPIPAVVTDSSHRVRIANSAYKEMVGQPECGWLDCAGGGRSKRIGGDVSLQFMESEPRPGMHGFHCRVKIQWEAAAGMKKVVHAECRAVKLGGQTKDYQFLWRFCTDN